VELKQGDVLYDLRQNSVLAEAFHAVGAARFGMLRTDQQGAIGGSTGTFQKALPPPCFKRPLNQFSILQILATSLMVGYAQLLRKKGPDVLYLL